MGAGHYGATRSRRSMIGHLLDPNLPSPDGYDPVKALNYIIRMKRFLSSHPLARRQRLRTIGRVVFWQIRSRISPGPFEVTFVNSTKLFARRGEVGVTGNIYFGLYEFEDMAFVAHILRPGDCFADIGANVGVYSVVAAGISGASVVAVEPAPETLNRLQANISLNRLEDLIRIEACAVTDTIGQVRFTATQDSRNHVASTSETEGVIQVPAKMVDSIFAGQMPLLIKIDVEGHEASVLRGAHKLLSNPALSAIIVEAYGENEKEVRDRLSQYGFVTRSYDPFTRRLGSVDRRQLKGTGNVLFVREAAEAEVTDRLEKAGHIIVCGMRI